ncbi:hypothetical protein AMAG_05161 [Allomyces macrogynus ATCC 38327]|uniref:DNA mismatch repair proteins mutS family domain-containing protein n=1 Tax=Allomyces macrogynus (strain ATCC 38327) TaxID=578462 RepID=A0A0L0SAU3_ALLM3|nr:hypothetical protein AMAG_05161 [Allomyces macrogynus ATCC 38327]|eukprot:KNE59698.1 hypothetical protein AMAG_05161 [Allomyces macrogynus ATCC 38327]
MPRQPPPGRAGASRTPNGSKQQSLFTYFGPRTTPGVAPATPSPTDGSTSSQLTLPSSSQPNAPPTPTLAPPRSRGPTGPQTLSPALPASSPGLAAVPSSPLAARSSRVVPPVEPAATPTRLPRAASSRLKRKVIISDDEDDNDDAADPSFAPEKMDVDLDSDDDPLLAMEAEFDDDLLASIPIADVVPPPPPKRPRLESATPTPVCSRQPTAASTPTVYAQTTPRNPFSATTTPHSSKAATPRTSATTTPQPSRAGSPLMRTADERKRDRAEKFQETNKSAYEWLKDIRDADGRRPSEPDYDPATLFVPESAWRKFSEFERQFWTVKHKYFDAVLFFKKGKFYELYERDADLARREFDLKISDNGRDAMRMAGVPEATFDEWALKFVAQGHKVARVDQMESATAKAMRDRATPARKDKVIKRELTAVLTAGTLVEALGDHATYCMALAEAKVMETDEMQIAVALVDTSTADMYVAAFTEDAARARLETLLMQVQPREVVVDKGHLSLTTKKLVQALCPTAAWNAIAFPYGDIQALHPFQFPDDKPLPPVLTRAVDHDDGVVLQAVGGLAMYLQRLKLDAPLTAAAAQGIHEYDLANQARTLVLDGAALANLHVLDGDRPLLSVLDRCTTPMGRRMLRTWVCHPLRGVAAIRTRQRAIAALIDADVSFKGVPDLDRLVGRVRMGCCKVKDFVALLNGMQRAVDAIEALAEMQLEADRVAQLVTECPLDVVRDRLAFFGAAFDSALAVRTGTIEPRAGVNADLDAAAAAVQAVHDALTAHLMTVRQRHGIKHAVFKDGGSKDRNQIEVPAGTKVPPNWKKTSGTKTVDRYHSPEVVKLNQQLAEAEEVKAEVVRGATAQMYVQFAESDEVWRVLSATVTELDVLAGLARAARDNEYTCFPEIVDAGDGTAAIDVRDLRHPSFGPDAGFIPNDVILGGGDETPRAMILTGPNMGGKSTIQRSLGLAIILAQLGSPIPATSCRLAPYDAVYTRIGARDNLVLGMSTLMVELHEASRILRNATPRSLVLMDELGRGTSTFDGHAIALATLHDLALYARSGVVFATHYHGLTAELPTKLVQNAHMACVEDPETREVTFLYKLVPGACPRSHGMNVARMAGVPETVVEHAEKVAAEFEAKHGEAMEVGKDEIGLAELAVVAALFAGVQAQDLETVKMVQRGLAV